MSAQHRLDLGALDLVGRDGGGGMYSYAVLADGFSPGAPEVVKEVVAGLLRDGQFSNTTRHNNRTVQFRVVIEAADSVGLAEGERLLWLECSKRATTLTWTPPDGYGAATVFDVVGASMVQEFDDLDELRLERTFTISLEAWPFPRSVGEVSFTLDDGVTLLSDGSSMAGWTVLSGSASSDGTDIVTTAAAATLRYTPTVDLDEYVELSGTAIFAGAITSVSIGGVVVPQTQWLIDGASPYIHLIPTGVSRGSKAVIEFAFTGATVKKVTNLATLSYPTNTTTTQSLTVFEAIGSARAPLTLSAYRSAGALGNVLLYTAPNPNALLQRGVPHAVFGTVTVTGGGIGGNGEGGVVSVDGVPKWFPSGTFIDTLGVTKPQPAFTDRRLYQPTPSVVTTAPTAGSVTVGTTYQYPTDRDAAVIFLEDVTYKAVWVIPPTPEMPEGGVFGGDQADGSDAVALTDEIKVYAPLAVHPERSGVWGIASNAGAVFTGSYFPAWLNHAGQ